MKKDIVNNALIYEKIKMLWKTISYKMLNKNVLEIILETSEINYKPGQRVLIDYKDPEKPLKRAYSIVEQKIKDSFHEITLVIKLNEWSKSSEYLRNIKEWNELEIAGAFGHFVLQDTDNPKVFIGTGTGIAPLIAMANATNSDKKLYFSVSYESELFYIDRIKEIENLDSFVHISRETIDGFHSGRIDLSNIDFSQDTEFYICGSPWAVESFSEELKSRWYDQIYTEKY